MSASQTSLPPIQFAVLNSIYGWAHDGRNSLDVSINADGEGDIVAIAKRIDAEAANATEGTFRTLEQVPKAIIEIELGKCGILDGAFSALETCGYIKIVQGDFQQTAAWRLPDGRRLIVVYLRTTNETTENGLAGGRFLTGSSQPAEVQYKRTIQVVETGYFVDGVFMASEIHARGYGPPTYRLEAKGIESVQAVRAQELAHAANMQSAPAATAVEQGDGVPDRARKAYEQYRQAAEALGKTKPTDKEAYDQLANAYKLAGEQDELPDFATWSRYLREYRRLTMQQKNTSRQGRKSQSIRKHTEV